MSLELAKSAIASSTVGSGGVAPSSVGWGVLGWTIGFALMYPESVLIFKDSITSPIVLTVNVIS